MTRQEAALRRAARVGLVGNTLLVIAAGTAFVVVMSVVMVIRVSGMTIRRLEPEEAERDPRTAEAGPCDDWARDHGLVFVGYYTDSVMGGLICAWQHTGQPTFLAQYVLAQGSGRRVEHDLVTCFEGDRVLTTGSSADGQLFPKPPGAYCQAFAGLSLDDLWARHTAAVAYLLTRGSARLRAAPPEFEQRFAAAIREQMGYVRSLPLWPLRCLYWYAVRKRSLYGLSVMEQHARRWIALPNEP